MFTLGSGHANGYDASFSVLNVLPALNFRSVTLSSLCFDIQSSIVHSPEVVRAHGCESDKNESQYREHSFPPLRHVQTYVLTQALCTLIPKNHKLLI